MKHSKLVVISLFLVATAAMGLSGCSSSEQAASVDSQGAAAGSAAEGGIRAGSQDATSTAEPGKESQSADPLAGAAGSVGSGGNSSGASADAGKGASRKPSKSPAGTPVPAKTTPDPPITGSTQDKVDFGGGVAVELAAVKAVTHKAEGPGELSGPAVDITLKITNSGSDPISLDDVIVNMAYGEDSVPALPMATADTPFSGSLATSKSATATYRFAVPVNERERVQISVNYAPDKPTVQLEGSVT